MFERFRKNDTPSPLDDQIAAVLESMTNYTVDSGEYPLLLRHLERLYELKTQTRKPPVSRDTMVLIAGNILVTLVIVAYEQKHVLTTKAPSMIIKPKI
jgi:hypothetical protein